MSVGADEDKTTPSRNLAVKGAERSGTDSGERCGIQGGLFFFKARGF